jgi:hypothetical protein
MTIDAYKEGTAHFIEHCNLISDSKRPDYTQMSADILANFKDAARDAGITPMQAWLVHFQKQYSAVARFIKTQGKEGAPAPSESITSRFADLYNYILLGHALYRESEHERTKRGI